MSVVGALLWSLPWVVVPIVTLLRFRRSRWLDAFPPDAATDAPLVSIIVPARNEARNIERCVRSLLSTRYPSVEIIVVDDASSDGTGDVARAIAASDSRLRVIDTPALPTGWFGKQWACATGARAARGELLLFTDADTRHGDDLLPRAVNALSDGADFVTVAGHQEMHSFWERIIQPQVFGMISMRYGGTENVSNAKRVEDVIANGQFILVRRGAYDAVGGHEIVRDRVAEDMALAQEFYRARRRILMLIATRQFSTHMYASLAELIAGWRKNMFAGGRGAVIGGAAGQRAYPFILLAVPLAGVVPPVVLALALLGVLSESWLLWSAIVVGVALVFWLVIYHFLRQPLWYALLYPLGSALLLYIASGSVRRGNRVEWKDRTYVAR
jgi:chlorobactene glucosyltransferase